MIPLTCSPWARWPLLGEARPVIPAGQNESIGSILRRLIEASVPGLDNSLVESIRTIPRWVKPAEETALVSARQLEETEFGLFRERPDARFVLEGRNHRLTASARLSITIADDGTGDALTQDIEPVLRSQDLVNIVRVPVRSFSPGAVEVLWSTGEITIPAGIISPGKGILPGPHSTTAECRGQRVDSVGGGDGLHHPNRLDGHERS